MKRYIQTVFAILGLACLAVACSGSDDTQDVPDGVLRISSAKNSLQADGTDAVTVKAMYGAADVSRSEHLTLVQVLDGAETELAAGVNTFTTAKAGQYTLKARYKDGEKIVDSENSLKVTANAVIEPADYYLKMLTMQFTSIGCINCPIMSSTLKVIQQEQPGRLAVAAFHLHYGGYSDPMYLKMGETIAKRYDVKGLPTGFLNMMPEVLSSEKSSITGAIDKELKNNPANCGVAIESSYNAASGEATVTTKVTSNVKEAYHYLVLLVEDGIEEMQLGAETPVYTHNNVVRAILSTNVYGERLNLGEPLQPGVEVTGKRTVAISPNWNREKMRVIAAALITKDNGVTYVCSNVNECKLGENADYLLNKD